MIDCDGTDTCRCDGCVNVNYPRSYSVIVAELRELIALHVRPEWRQWALDGLPVMGQLELFR